METMTRQVSSYIDESIPYGSSIPTRRPGSSANMLTQMASTVATPAARRRYDWDPLGIFSSGILPEPAKETDKDSELKYGSAQKNADSSNDDNNIKNGTGAALFELPPDVLIRDDTTTAVPQHQILEVDVPDPDASTEHPLRKVGPGVIASKADEAHDPLFGKPQDPSKLIRTTNIIYFSVLNER